MCLGAWAAAAQTKTPELQPPSSQSIDVLQRPSSEEQAKLLDEMREYTMNCIHRLPDFICVEQASRYVDTGTDSWRRLDVLTAQAQLFQPARRL